MKRYLMGTVKALDDDGEDANGSFEVILSAPTLDRDGEVIDAEAFEPLPDHVTGSPPRRRGRAQERDLAGCGHGLTPAQAGTGAAIAAFTPEP